MPLLNMKNLDQLFGTDEVETASKLMKMSCEMSSMILTDAKVKQVEVMIESVKTGDAKKKVETELLKEKVIEQKLKNKTAIEVVKTKKELDNTIAELKAELAKLQKPTN